MLTFNGLLHAAGIGPRRVRLARHRAGGPKDQRRLSDLAFARHPIFAGYQERRGSPEAIKQFRAAKYIAGFIMEPLTKQTVCTGLWQRLGERTRLLGDPFFPDRPIKSHGYVEFNTRRVEAFDDYTGRLVVEWGKGWRAWVQRADRQDKTIIELRKQRADPNFIGYLNHCIPLDQIEGVYVGWSQVLRSVRGIYLLVHRKSGDPYVGSASGVDGFYGRWCSYADGHGGNVGMKALVAPASAFDASILEVVGSALTPEQIFERETVWKDKLGTRAKGLNRN